MKTMQAWQVRAWGEPEEMILAETAVPEPGQGEVRIAHRAAALNFFDILQIQGKYQIKPLFPFTPGAEVAGTIDALGDGVTAWSVCPTGWTFPKRRPYRSFITLPISPSSSARPCRAASGCWCTRGPAAWGCRLFRSAKPWEPESSPRQAARKSWSSAGRRAPDTSSIMGRRAGWTG